MNYIGVFRRKIYIRKSIWGISQSKKLAKCISVLSTTRPRYNDASWQRQADHSNKTSQFDGCFECGGKDHIARGCLQRFKRPEERGEETNVVFHVRSMILKTALPHLNPRPLIQKQVKINGIFFPCVFDTGVTTSVIQVRVANELGLQLETKVRMWNLETITEKSNLAPQQLTSNLKDANEQQRLLHQKKQINHFISA